MERSPTAVTSVVKPLARLLISTLTAGSTQERSPTAVTSVVNYLAVLVTSTYTIGGYTLGKSPTAVKAVINSTLPQLI